MPIVGIILTSMVPFAGGTAQSKSGASKSEPLLSHLVGSWDMSGKVGSKAVRYSFEGKRVLHGKYVHMHMKELGVPSQYEADVCIGYDTTRSCYVTF